jgi:hypothetical protein
MSAYSKTHFLFFLEKYWWMSVLVLWAFIFMGRLTKLTPYIFASIIIILSSLHFALVLKGSGYFLLFSSCLGLVSGFYFVQLNFDEFNCVCYDLEDFGRSYYRGKAPLKGVFEKSNQSVSLISWDRRGGILSNVQDISEKVINLNFSQREYRIPIESLVYDKKSEVLGFRFLTSPIEQDTLKLINKLERFGRLV